MDKLILNSCVFVENYNIVEHMSSRLQPRRSVKTVLNYYEDAQESEDDYDSDHDHGYSAPNPRRGKSRLEQGGSEAKQTRRRRSGKLSKLPAMPLDVMYEVRVARCSLRVRAYFSGQPDLLAAPPSGLAESILDDESLSGCPDRPLFETDLEDVVGFR